MKERPGTPKAITATAHQPARILRHLIKHRTPYDPAVWPHAEEKLRLRKIRRLRPSAAALGFQLSAAHELTRLVSQEAALASLGIFQ